LKKSVFLQPQKIIVLTFKKKEVFFMIVVPVKEGETIERALKKLKRKFEKTGVVRELRARQKFTKPSVIKREQKLKAIYVQQLQSKEADK
jgi:small subunit ribosomal protein S21